MESRTTGTSTNTEVTNESVVSELKVIMKNRGLTFTEEEFEAFIATERGNHLLQNIKLTMEKDKLKLQNEEQQQALVQTNENAPNQHVAALKDLLESRGMYLSDDELQEFVRTPRGQELLKQVVLLNERQQDAKAWSNANGPPPPPLGSSP